ncbi:protein of unknown function [Rhodovastum atsumiense]|nr:protein of unknown function [Rhodovastum atsumiense]
MQVHYKFTGTFKNKSEIRVSILIRIRYYSVIDFSFAYNLYIAQATRGFALATPQAGLSGTVSDRPPAGRTGRPGRVRTPGQPRSLHGRHRRKAARKGNIMAMRRLGDRQSPPWEIVGQAGSRRSPA